MTRIEVEAILPATPLAVWRTLLDYARWPEWCAAAACPDAMPAAQFSPAGVSDGEDLGEDLEDQQSSFSLADVSIPKPPLAALDSVALVLGPAAKVGALRRCAATFTALPLLGHRTVHWTDQLTDAACPWTLELEILDRLPFRRCRLRCWVIEHAEGQTRLRLRLSYAPALPLFWLLDLFILRRTASRYLQSALGSLAKTFEPLPAVASEDASPEPAPTLEPVPTAVAA